jgi:3-isopropylmalate/(R)-2-methylmalate dehydratase small subunit
MEAFRSHTGRVAPLVRRDIDTDQIIPKQFLKRLGRTGFADALFYDWRADGHGRPRAEFVLNQPRFAGASILLAGANFGCGSSREHAVWALRDFGFRVVLAPSFADIFASNALANGLLAARLDESTVAGVAGRAEASPDARFTVDLESERLTVDDGFSCAIGVDPLTRRRLLDGLDDIALILQHEAAIRAYEAAHRRA